LFGFLFLKNEDAKLLRGLAEDLIITLDEDPIAVELGALRLMVNSHLWFWALPSSFHFSFI
jgi:hypothetical protein